MIRALRASDADDDHGARKAHLAGLSPGERRALARRHIFVPTKRAKYILARLDELLLLEQSTYPLSYIFTGESGTGKTTLLNQFKSAHASGFDSYREQDRKSVVSMEMPTDPTLGKFYGALVRALGYPDILRTIGRTMGFAMERLGELGTRVLIIDEVQHIGSAGKHRKESLMDELKAITNRGFAIVATGIPAARGMFQQNHQLWRRFEPLELDRFKKIDTEFRQVLETIDRGLPLRDRSGLSDQELATALHAMSNGMLGELWRVLEQATLRAIDCGSERITSDILKDVARMRGGVRW